jgi:tRNA (guanine-N7-)-methyltransferase
MESLLPQIAVDLAEPLAKTTGRRWLEIGFGGGEHVAHQALCHPDVSMIGAEAFLNGVAKLLAHIEETNVSNLRIYYGDARALLEALPDNCLERIYLLYPDPWPKERQKKRRFVSDANLAQFNRVLVPDGLFLFASDISDYVSWTVEHVARSGQFAAVQQGSELFADWKMTRYEAKAKREGRSSEYLIFKNIKQKQ